MLAAPNDQSILTLPSCCTSLIDPFLGSLQMANNSTVTFHYVRYQATSSSGSAKMSWRTCSYAASLPYFN